MDALPTCTQIDVERRGPHLHVTLARPETRNALTQIMIGELAAVFDAVAEDRSLASIVVRGAGGTFCAGGDLKGFDAAGAAAPDGADPLIAENRRFGRFMMRMDRQSQAIVVVVEGAAFGGGFGLICGSDVALVHADARLALSETGLGLPPAQIAPFVVRRIGLTHARRLALTGHRLCGHEAVSIGLAHEAYDDTTALDRGLVDTLALIERCAPSANAATKRILHDSLERPLGDVLDSAATAFAAALRGAEGREGVRAFVEKRRPDWFGA